MYPLQIDRTGIEGDDVPFHLTLLGNYIANFGDTIRFFPLVDHYNTHNEQWIIDQTTVSSTYNTVIFYDLVNTGDYEHSKFCEFISNFNHPHKIYLTVNQCSTLQLADVEIVHWDFMWNRIKSYYTVAIPENLALHHYAGPGKYELPVIDFDTIRSGVFLSMCGREFGYRTNLYNLVAGLNGYVSNRSRGITLGSVEGAFQPPPNNYYADSYFSVYVESNWVRTDLMHITEKTFEPLIKGHFILPFSNPGTIQRLRDMGFRFPEFIDYRYDTELDVARRFNMLQIEFARLLNLDWPTLYMEHKDMLLHNQNCINTIPLDTRILKLYDV